MDLTTVVQGHEELLMLSGLLLLLSAIAFVYLARRIVHLNAKILEQQELLASVEQSKLSANSSSNKDSKSDQDQISDLLSAKGLLFFERIVGLSNPNLGNFT